MGFCEGWDGDQIRPRQLRMLRTYISNYMVMIPTPNFPRRVKSTTLDFRTFIGQEVLTGASSIEQASDSARVVVRVPDLATSRLFLTSHLSPYLPLCTEKHRFTFHLFAFVFLFDPEPRLPSKKSPRPWFRVPQSLVHPHEKHRVDKGSSMLHVLTDS